MDGSICVGSRVTDYNGSHSPPYAAQGFFVLSTDDEVRVVPCAPAEACIGGPNNTCARGYRGSETNCSLRC